MSLSSLKYPSIDLNIFLLQYKATGIGHNFKNLDGPLPKKYETPHKFACHNQLN